jgi:AcrR family transcriptional regulator
MSSSVDKASTQRRPHDSEATRQALLTAGGSVFDELGYDRATTREIGERAGVDPALIARYFSCKEGLFLAAIGEAEKEGHADLTPGEMIAMLLERWDERGHSPISRALASPALSDDVRDQVSEVVGEKLLKPVARRLGERGVPEPELRAEILIAIAVGVAMTRANGTLETLAAAPRDAVLEVLEPIVQALGRGE